MHFGRNFLVVMVYTSIGAFDGLSIQFYSILSHLRKQMHEFEKQIFMPQKLKLRLTVLDWINSIEYLKKGRNKCSLLLFQRQMVVKSKKRIEQFVPTVSKRLFSSYTRLSRLKFNSNCLLLLSLSFRIIHKLGRR